MQRACFNGAAGAEQRNPRRSLAVVAEHLRVCDVEAEADVEVPDDAAVGAVAEVADGVLGGGLAVDRLFQTEAALQRGSGTTRSLEQSAKSIGLISTPSGVASMRNSHLKSFCGAPSGSLGSRLPRDGEMKRTSMLP